MAKRFPLTLSSLMKKSIITSVMAFLLFTFLELATTEFSFAQNLTSSAQSIALYSNQTGDNLTAIYVTAIGGAQESVSMVIYSLSDPKIIEALQKKSEEGIPVYIVCDANATRGITTQIPKATVIRRVTSGIMHQKILVVDGKQILLGSANMTSESLNVHGNLIMALDHPALAHVLSQKAHSMDAEGHSNQALHSTTMAGDQNLELWLLPDDTKAVKRLVQLIQSAQKTIKVAMFTWTRADLTQELIDASKRGVQVETVIDRYSGKGASAKIVRMLNEAGISVRLSTGQGLLHHKFAYIDDTILVNGSANWTKAAFSFNDDVFMIVSPLSTEQQKKMNTLWDTISKQSKKA